MSAPGRKQLSDSERSVIAEQIKKHQPEWAAQMKKFQELGMGFTVLSVTTPEFQFRRDEPCGDSKSTAD